LALVALLLLWAVASVPAAAAAPTWVAAPPAAPVPAAGRAVVTVYALNNSGTETAVVFPVTLACRLRGEGAEDSAALLQRQGAEPTATLASGAFAQAEYALDLPVGLAGRVSVEFADGTIPPLLLEILAAGGEPGAEGRPRSEKLAAAGVVPPPPARLLPNLQAHEPMYFVFGPNSPNIRYQLSLKHGVFADESRAVRWQPWLRDLYLAYTQTSLWDWDKPSSPFYDSSYKPELFLLHPDVGRSRRPAWLHGLDLQYGLLHESNGKGGDDSRSLNIAYLRPSLRFGRTDRLHLTLEPRAWVYVGHLNDNPDLPDYRGYADLTAKVGYGDGWQLAAQVRAGDRLDRGSLQLDFTWPLRRMFGLLPCLHIQYFTGYGESLLRYDETSSALRCGIAIER
jgi:outer membrane phospholipase A